LASTNDSFADSVPDKRKARAKIGSKQRGPKDLEKELRPIERKAAHQKAGLQAGNN